MRQRLIPLLLLLAPAVAGCAREAGVFSVQNASAHIDMLAGTIGSRPVGSDANARARAYLIDQLKLYGLEVRVQETDARRAALGRTAHVSNIIGLLPGHAPRGHRPGRALRLGAGRSRRRRQRAWRRGHARNRARARRPAVLVSGRRTCC